MDVSINHMDMTLVSMAQKILPKTAIYERRPMGFLQDLLPDFNETPELYVTNYALFNGIKNFKIGSLKVGLKINKIKIDICNFEFILKTRTNLGNVFNSHL